jgi:hypothetical protein
MKRLFIFVLCIAASPISVQKAAAQQPVASPTPENPAAASLVARNTVTKSSHPESPRPAVDQTARQINQTKVVRIYGGSGYFDLAMAEKLRPMLAKGFASSEPDPVKSVPDKVSAPAKANSQEGVLGVSNL